MVLAIKLVCFMKERKRRFNNLLICFISAFLLLSMLTPVCFAVDVDQARSSVSRAEQTLGSVYFQVADAAASGADVSGLLNKLDVAGSYLSEAFAALKRDDYEQALQKAASCENELTGLEEQAVSLKAEAKDASDLGLSERVIGSVIGLVLVIVLGFFGWRILKRTYLKRSLD
jgi:predicted DNA repair protein MutK